MYNTRYEYRLTAMMWITFLSMVASTVHADPQTDAENQRPRARDIGLNIGILDPGPFNAITDVTGVLVGHQTVIKEQDVRTGVTAIVPHGGNIFQEKVPAAIVVGNGFGKLVGSTQVNELGTLETPILLTNTLSVFQAANVLMGYLLRLPGNNNVNSINPVVAETNDGYLNNIRSRRVGPMDVILAVTTAQAGPVQEGSVGAGTGTRCLGWKGGIGTASRVLPHSLGSYTVGVLTQTNFGGILTVNGAPIGKALGRYYLKDMVVDKPSSGGSCIIVVATDAPMSSRQLRRLAKRALLGLAAVGSPMTHGSGDYVIAFSTAKEVRIPHQAGFRTHSPTILRDEALSPLFQAVKEATEEAIINSLLKATTIIGYQGRTCQAIPLDRFIEVCKQYGVIQP